MGGEEPENEVMESELSKEQAKILTAREELYQDFMLPELKNYYKQSKELELNSDYADLSNFSDLAVSNNQKAFATQDNMLQKMLGQRGNNSSDASEMLKVQSMRADNRMGNRAQLQEILQHNNQLQKQNMNTLNEAQVRQAGIDMLSSQATTPTSAAPVFFHQTPGKQGVGAQIGQAAMGAMGSMGSMGGDMGSMFSKSSK
jgi:hypothetical protein